MDITINELGQLTPDSYILLDMRGDVEVGHGIIPGAIDILWLFNKYKRQKSFL